MIVQGHCTGNLEPADNTLDTLVAPVTLTLTRGDLRVGRCTADQNELSTSTLSKLNRITK